MIGNSSRINRGEESAYNSSKTFQQIKIGEVMSVDDPQGLNRIKVWIKGSVSNGGDDELLVKKLDGTFTYENLPWCLPLMPKHVFITPKVGENVLIFVFSKQKEGADRLYMGPIISQLTNLNKDNAWTSALAGFTFGPTPPSITVDNIPDLKGVFPNPEDVSIQGRYNTDITQKNNEIVIRAGKFIETQITELNPYPIKFNSNTPAYIQIKNNVNLPKISDTEIGDRIGTVTNIVANKINLITHGGSPNYNITNQIDLIAMDELEKILTTAHQLPFGDVLLEYLRLLKNAILLHVHNGNGNVATDIGANRAIKTLVDNASRLESTMLSKNVRIN